MESPVTITTADDGDDEEVGLLKETICLKKNLPPLLSRLEDVRVETLDSHTSYTGGKPLCSFSQYSMYYSYRFWSQSGYIPVYVRRTPVRPHVMCIYPSSHYRVTLLVSYSCIILQLFNNDST